MKFNGYFYIAYDKDDIPVAIFETTEEAMEFFMKCSKASLRSSLSRASKGQQTVEDNKGHKYSVYKIVG